MNLLLKPLVDAVLAFVETFRPKTWFSWQTAFLLSLFSWIMAWLSIDNITQDFGGLLPTDTVPGEVDAASDGMLPITRTLFTMGWIFLTIAVGWLLAKQKIKVPILAIVIKPAIWVTSALTSAFLFEVWNAATFPFVLISWPIIFAAYATLSKFFIISDNRFTSPEPAVRQQLIITTLICFVLSCWIWFHFTVQRWIFEEQPILHLVDFSNNAFVVQVGTPPIALSLIDRALQDELGTLSIPEVRRWMVRPEENMPGLNERLRRILRTAEQEITWELEIYPERISNPRFVLDILPVSNPNSNRPGDRIGLERTCRVIAAGALGSNTLELVEPSEDRSLLQDDGTGGDAIEQPLPNAETGTASEAEDDPEAQSVAEQVWDAISLLLGLDNEPDTDNQTAQERGFIEDDELPSPEQASPRRNDPSQVRCEPISSLFLETNR